MAIASAVVRGIVPGWPATHPVPSRLAPNRESPRGLLDARKLEGLNREGARGFCLRRAPISHGFNFAGVPLRRVGGAEEWRGFRSTRAAFALGAVEAAPGAATSPVDRGSHFSPSAL